MKNSRFKKKFINVISVIGSFVFLIGISIHIYNRGIINSESKVRATYNLNKEEFNGMKDLVLNKKYITYQISGNKINICDENEYKEFPHEDENKKTILLFMKKFKLESININFDAKSVKFYFKISIFDIHPVGYFLIYSEISIREKNFIEKIDGAEKWYVDYFIYI